MPDKNQLQNIFQTKLDSIPNHPAGESEIIETLFTGTEFRLERIVSHGHASEPGFWYDQEEDEWVLLISGRAKLLFEGESKPVDMKPGDYIHIPAHRKHRVEWTAPDENSVWLAIHYQA